MKTATESMVERINKLNWKELSESLWAHGYALTSVVLNEAECGKIASMFNEAVRFRSVTDMAKKRFGSGVYKYLKYPLPEPIGEMRNAIYEHIAPIANEFNEALKLPDRFPKTHEELLKQCKKAGQNRPTPLLLHYDEGDFNCLHQDIYGELTFPLQVTGFLSKPGKDYTGGEFLLSEQMMRMQSRVHVLKPVQGQLLIFTTRWRPERTERGFRRVNVKHGVATIEHGSRDTFGIIFHDAE